MTSSNILSSTASAKFLEEKGRANTTRDLRAPSVGGDKKLTESEYRKKIVDELLETEKVYLNSLEIMIKRYLEPLRSSARFGKEPFEEIFSNVEDIFKANKLLCGRLEEACSKWSDESGIGDTFLTEGAVLKPYYMQYTQAYQGAQNSLAVCEKSPAFAAFLKETQESCNENIRSLQIKPIQRITRYTLLLGDLVKRTPPEHPDYQNLTNSLEKMVQTAKNVNEVVKAGENRQKILNIQNSFLGRMDLLVAHRVFIREGVLMKVCRKSTKQRWFFLFNDLLVHASLTGLGKFTCHQLWSLSEIRTEDIANRDTSGTAFQIVTGSKSFVVYAINKAEKIDWLKDISEAIEEFAKKRATFKSQSNDKKPEAARLEAPVWQQDSEASQCTVCSLEFSFFNRRHHCRRCGRVTCDSCTSKRMCLPNMGSSAVRVCNECFETPLEAAPVT